VLPAGEPEPDELDEAEGWAAVAGWALDEADEDELWLLEECPRRNTSQTSAIAMIATSAI
jgi:hypothetical protein